jgi:hypothetical protein
MQDPVRQETHRVRCPCGAWAQLRIARCDNRTGAPRATVVMLSCPDQARHGHGCVADEQLLALIPPGEMHIDARVLDPAFPRPVQPLTS